MCCGLIFKGACGEVLIDPRLFKPCCPTQTQIPSPEATEAAGNSIGGMSDGGSFYEDEGLESLDEEHSSADAFYGSSSSPSSLSKDPQKTSLLTELAAALIT